MQAVSGVEGSIKVLSAPAGAGQEPAQPKVLRGGVCVRTGEQVRRAGCRHARHPYLPLLRLLEVCIEGVARPCRSACTAAACVFVGGSSQQLRRACAWVVVLLPAASAAAGLVLHQEVWEC